MKKSEFFRKLSIKFGEAAEKATTQEYLCVITQFGFPDGKTLRHNLLENVLRMEGIKLCGNGFSTKRELRYYREKYHKDKNLPHQYINLPQKYTNLLNFRRIFFCLMMAKHFEDQGM